MIETDVLIVGSGPAGVNAAWPLVQAGLSVVMLDADSRLLPSAPESSLDGLRHHPDAWRYYLGDDLGGLLVQGDFSPKLATPLGRNVIGMGNDAFPKVRARNFLAMRSATPGGLSAIWGAFCSVFDARDMASFPISAADLAPAYRAVAERIGISGANGTDPLADFHGADLTLQAPVPLSPPAARLFHRYRSSPPVEGFSLGLARNAVITETHNGREACNQCGLCLLGCARKSIYNSAYELSALGRHANFSYISGMPVRRLLSLGGERQVAEVAGGDTIRAKRILLAAGTVNSTALILEYAGLYGTRLRVLSNPVAGMAFIMPGLVGDQVPPGQFGLGQLSYRLSLGPNHEYVTGVIYSATTLPLEVFARRMPLSRPVAMRLSAVLAPGLLPATAYLPGRYSMNSLSLEKRAGGTEVILEGHISSEARQQLDDAGNKLGRLMRRYGAYLVPGSLTISPPGSDAHLGGTIPMGGQGKLNCSTECELNIASGVHVIDGSWLPVLPAKHCTFTIMANAYRIGSILADKLH